MYEQNNDSPLKPLEISNWRETRAARLQPLPKNLVLLGRKLLNLEKDKSSRPHHWYNRQRVDPDEFAALSAEDRGRIFHALFPKISGEIEAGWQLIRTLPYERQQAFRAPNHPLLYSARQVNWLVSLIEQLGPYEEHLPWIAAWSHELINWRGTELSLLLAAAINAGGDMAEEILQSLIAATRNQPSGVQFSGVVIQTLQLADRAEGWDAIERLLLAAQRQEGLRQSILEAVDMANPVAFRRIVKLILDEDLIRFSSVLRAFCVWFGLRYEAEARRHVAKLLVQADALLGDPAACEAALHNENPEVAYLALCVFGFADIDVGIAHADALLASGSKQHRFVAAHFLTCSNLSMADAPLLRALRDPDPLVAATALNGLNRYRLQHGNHAHQQQVIEQLEAALPTFTAKAITLTSPLWTWHSVESSKALVADTMLDMTSAEMLPAIYSYIDVLSANGRAHLMRGLDERKSLSMDEYELVLRGVGDRSTWVQEKAYDILKRAALLPNAAATLESYLTRKDSTLRQRILELLLTLSDEQVLASADRLTASSSGQQRQAGLALLVEMVAQNRSSVQCRKRAQRLRSQNEDEPIPNSNSTKNGSVAKKKASKKQSQAKQFERQLIDTILRTEGPPITLVDGLGLFNPTDRTPPLQPQLHPLKKHPSLVQHLLGDKDAAYEYLQTLPHLIEEHANHTVTQIDWAGNPQEELFGNLQWGFGAWDRGYTFGDTVPEIPLSNVWRKWWADRPDSLRDGGEFALFQLFAGRTSGSTQYYFSEFEDDTPRLAKQKVEKICAELYGTFSGGEAKWAYGQIARDIVNWLILQLDLTPDTIERILNAVEQSHYLAAKADTKNAGAWRAHEAWRGWIHVARYCRAKFAPQWDAEDLTRFWRLMRWFDEPTIDGLCRARPSFALLMAAYHAGGATQADLLDHLLGSRNIERYGVHFAELRQYSKLNADVSAYGTEAAADLLAAVDACRKRILEIELQRGEVETAASLPALALSYVGGITEFCLLLQALANQDLKRGRRYRDTSRDQVYTHLLRSTFPTPDETPEKVGPNIAALNLPAQQLIEVALLAPQWAAHLQEALGWPAFSDAVWWLHAHTKDDRWDVTAKIRGTWTAQISQRTRVDAQALLDGAVDVGWFHLIHNALGKKRWQQVADAARFTSTGTGHKRAQLFAMAMLGQISEKALGKRIQKRNQDAVRALGLLPLPAGKKQEKIVLKRYEAYQEFLHESSKFGSQRQANKKLAVTIGLQNLARAAGYPDPTRLTWAMERHSVADLLAGPVGDTTVALSINGLGEPQIDICKLDKNKKEKPLKHISKTIKKELAIIALQERKREIIKQTRRMRTSLEEAMCRGNIFHASELADLMQHPILRPMLEDLVFVAGNKIGYPSRDGQQLLDTAGKHHKLTADDTLRIAHPYDIYATDAWSAWQQECFVRERIQPFRQVFRELYIITPAEEEAKTQSRRYAGHQVNARQVRAILGKRGWISAGYGAGYGDEGGTHKTFHMEGITAWIHQAGGYGTPMDVEGLTIETIYFTNRGEWKPIPLLDVPPRVFSEVMRDVDLIVSVAHQGGVDPEASASTVAIRGSLVRETANLLELDTIEVTKSHALIDGSRGSYSVHLASGVVHRKPGNYVCIVPVHAQHRGRLFLPFIDNDPKTAEILSKVILLARDEEIQDPTILAQLRVKK